MPRAGRRERLKQSQQSGAPREPTEIVPAAPGHPSATRGPYLRGRRPGGPI